MADGGDGGGAAPDTFTQAQLHAAIEKARGEERTKLRADLDAAVAAMQASEASVTRLTGELQNTTGLLTAANQSLDALKAAKTADGTVDVPKLIAEVTAKVEASFNQVAKSEREQFTTQVGNLNQRLTALQLEKLQAQLIQEAGGADKLILSLVDASDETRLRASVANAKKVFEETEQAVLKRAGVTPTSQQHGNGNGTPAAPPILAPAGAGGAGSGQSATVLAKVKEMGTKDFAANRSQIINGLKTLYPAASR